MNIGIVVYSQTGHTLEVCEKLRDRLIGEGHTAQIARVSVAGERTPKPKTFELADKPDVAAFEAIVFASYVEAFSLCPVMRRFMEDIGTLEGKKVACFVTQQFPFPWMGGNRAVRQLSKLCQSKGASARATAVVNWAKKKRDKTMAMAVDRISKLF